MAVSGYRRRLARLSILVLLVSSAVVGLDRVGVTAAVCGSSSLSVLTTPAPAPWYNMLTSVDSISANDAWAVGHSATTLRTLTEHWDGGSWTIVPSPDVGTGDDGFNEVVQSSGSDAWSLGYSTVDFNRFATLAEHWDGSSWSVVPTPNPGADSNVIVGGAAISSSDVWAVGFSLAGSSYSTLIEHWDGASWTAMASPNPGTQSNVLIGAAASSASDAWAVGYSVSGSTTRTLLEHWDGSAWSAVPSPNPAGNQAILTSVAAASGGAWAVGYSTWGSTYRALAEHWDGASWSIVPSLDPSSSFAAFRGVGADQSGAAWAVGSYTGPAGNYRVLAERWDGTSWSQVPINGVQFGALLSVFVGPDPGEVMASGYTNTQLPLVVSTCSPSATGPSAAALRHGSDQPARHGVSGEAPTIPRSESRASSTPVASFRRAAGSATGATTAVDEASSAGIYEITKSYGAAVGDVNGDGWPDVFLGRHGGLGRLYRNDQGHFTEIDAGTFVGSDRHGCAWLDWNQDGLQDLVCAVGGERGYGLKSNELWVQRPDSTFVNQGPVRGLADPFGRSREVVTLDANGDGRTDIFLTNLNTRPDGLPTPDRLFLNTGGGFRLALFYGVDNEIGSICAAAADINGDGRPDLVTCPRLGGLHFYLNDKGQRFVDASAAFGVSSDQGVKDVAIADFNGDGLPDIAEVFPAQVVVRLQLAGRFLSVFSSPLRYGMWVATGDVNADGRPDIYVSETLNTANSPDVMLLNDGTGTSFTSTPIPDTSQGIGGQVSSIDYNRNGATDFIVINGTDQAGPVQLISFYPQPIEPGNPRP
jgi:FG-GAP-like repeat